MRISEYSSKAFIILHSFCDLTHFRELGQKYKNIFGNILVQMMTSKFILKLSELYQEKEILEYNGKTYFCCDKLDETLITWQTN